MEFLTKKAKRKREETPQHKGNMGYFYVFQFWVSGKEMD